MHPSHPRVSISHSLNPEKSKTCDSFPPVFLSMSVYSQKHILNKSLNCLYLPLQESMFSGLDLCSVGTPFLVCLFGDTVCNPINPCLILMMHQSHLRHLHLTARSSSAKPASCSVCVGLPHKKYEKYANKSSQE